MVTVRVVRGWVRVVVLGLAASLSLSLCACCHIRSRSNVLIILTKCHVDNRMSVTVRLPSRCYLGFMLSMDRCTFVHPQPYNSDVQLPICEVLS